MDCSAFWDCFQNGVSLWIDWKRIIKKAAGWRSDSLHVLWGVLIQFGLAFLLRKSIASYLPWLLLLALAGVNEGIDLWRGPHFDYADSIKDVLLTMLLPTFFLITTRRFPELYRPAN